jgi:ABC-type amino acid transport substrate-binding protein
LIVSVKGEIQNLKDLFKLFWSFQIFNVNVLFENKSGEVLVKSFEPFSRIKCDDSTPIVVNEYRNGKFENKNFFPRKMRNLNNCGVKVPIGTDSEPHVIVELRSDGSLVAQGPDISLLNVLSESLNFKIDYIYVGDTGYLLSNGSATGFFKSLKDGSADITIATWSIKSNRIAHFDFTTSYANDVLTFIIPPGRRLTALEQLVYPFSFYLWTSLAFVLMAGIFVICLIKTRSTNIQNFTFGSNVGSPFVNILAAFIGGSQNRLPKRNFARFLLMIFLLYSLIIRTSYQGSFFKLLNSDELYGQIRSIEELIERDFKIYAQIGTTDVFQDSEVFKNR